MASESGVLPIPDSKIVKKWRLQPGKMFLIDLVAGRIIDDKEIKDTYANAKPYKDWIKSVRIKLDEIRPWPTVPGCAASWCWPATSCAACASSRSSCW